MRFVIALLAMAVCAWAAPTPQVNTGNWQAFWQMAPGGNAMMFTVTANVANVGNAPWVSIGLSPGTQSHAGSDMITALVSSAGMQVMDTFSDTKALPQFDIQQNVNNAQVMFNANAGTLTFTFSRALKTGDPNGEDLDIVAGRTYCIGWGLGGGSTGQNQNANYKKHANGDRGNVNNIDIMAMAAAPPPTAAGQTLAPTPAPTTPPPTTPAPTRAPTTAKVLAPGQMRYTTPGGDFTAIWSIDNVAKNITMEMSALAGGYISVSFSPKTSHAQSDMYVGWIDSAGQIVLLDTFSDTINAQPTFDLQQDATILGGKLDANTLTISFTRKLDTGDVGNDMVITNAPIDLGWCYSNVPGAGTGIDASYAYHGKVTRGNQIVNFMTGQLITQAPTAAPVGNVFAAPGGNYNVQWMKSADNTAFTFTMQGKGAGWVSVGFSDTLGHVNNDIYVGFMDTTGKAVVIDTSSNTKLIPVYDAQQDATMVSGSNANGVLTITFTRLVDTKDTADHIIPNAPVTVTWAIGADQPTGTGAQTFYKTHLVGDLTARGEVTINLFTGGVVANNNVRPDLALTYIACALIGAYALVRFTWKMYKMVRMSGSASAMMKGDMTDMDYEDDTPVQQYYYRGSVAVPYGKTLNDIAVDTPKTVSSSKRFRKVQEQYGKALLSTKDVAKGAGNSFGNMISMFFSKRVPKTSFSIADLLFGVFWLALNIGITVYQNNLPTGYKWYLTLGYLATANSLFVALPATRNSVLVWLLGLPFDKTIMYHRWIGRLVVIEAGLHMLGYPITTRPLYPNNKWDFGVVAFVFLLLILITSIGTLRRKHFNFFFNFHFVFIPYYVFGALHSPKISFVFFAYAAAAFYFLDRAIRMFWGAFPTRTVKIEVISGAVRVVFKKHFAASYKVGQYVFLNFPELGLLEWHPFTLASGPDEAYLEVMIKGLGDHTRKLLAAAESNKQLWIRVDGPYGKWPQNFARFKAVVLVAGGVGVTPSMALIRHVYHINRESHEVDPHLQDVFFVWSCRNEREFGWYREMLEEAMARSALENSKYPRLHAYVHVTKPDGGIELPGYTRSGRPVLNEIFGRVEQCATALGGSDGCRVAVVACGPEVMVSEAWDQTSARTKGNMRFDFHHETFEF